jgi:hypothetical protein
MMRVLLPPLINADGLLPFLSLLGASPQAGEEVVVDFAQLRRVTPLGLTALVATVMHWRKLRHPIVFDGLNTCTITGYLQRMDLFSVCGIDLSENFQRHDA